MKHLKVVIKSEEKGKLVACTDKTVKFYNENDEEVFIPNLRGFTINCNAWDVPKMTLEVFINELEIDGAEISLFDSEYVYTVRNQKVEK